MLQKIKCKNCQKLINADSIVCKHCGLAVKDSLYGFNRSDRQEKTGTLCKKCGFVNQLFAEICEKCKQPIS